MENLTADQLVSFFTGDGLLATCINLIAFLAGIIVHVRNEIIREDISLGSYWKIHGKRSLASIGTLCTAFIGMMFMDTDASIISYFTAAFAGNAIANKTPTKNEV